MPQPACSICGQRVGQPFFTLEHVPVHCNVQWSSREAARCVPFGDIRLAFCCHCGHIFNLAFDPDRVEYTERYENSLHFSPHFEDYALQLAEDLVERYRLKYKQIVEIGAGKAEFLGMLCVMGHNKGVGFDPGYPADSAPEAGKPIRFVADAYSTRYADLRPDLIVCRQVLEHLAEPLSVLREVRLAAGNRNYPPNFFEVPNVLYTLRDLGIWDIIYEHVSYFSAVSLRAAFARTGFEVFDVKEAYGGQFLQLNALPGEEPHREWRPEPQTLAELGRRAASFARHFEEKVRTWRDRLAANREKTVLWGAGSKGVTFLNVFSAMRPVEYVVDLNPRKQGLYIAGTGQQIVAPEFLADYRPDLILIANPLYENEIRSLTSRLGLNPDFAAL